jgi:folate-binding protein YgfZ
MASLLERAFIRARGPDARAYLNSMLSNDLTELRPGEGVYALLLTPKARIVADLEVLFLTAGDIVLAVPPQTAGEVHTTLLRSRFRKKVELEPAELALAWGGEQDGGLARLDTPVGRLTLLAGRDGLPAAGEEFEVARVEAGVPRFGREFGPESMPAEAGLEQRAISFSKGCYPGQEPVARLHYRGHANRGVRGLRLAAPVPDGTPVSAVDGREVGRVTTAVVSERFGPIALSVLRAEVADGAAVKAGDTPATVAALPFAGDRG